MQIGIAARKFYRKSVNQLILECVKEKVKHARNTRPSLFEPKPLADLKPVDRTIYAILTNEGRRTPDDLIAETGLPRSTVKGSLERLVRAGYVYTLPQGQATPGQPGAVKLIYISSLEQ